MIPLINIDQIRKYRPDVSINIDAEKITAYVVAAQMFSIKPALGDALFSVLLLEYSASPVTDRMAKLMNGDRYTPCNAGFPIYYYGLIPAIVEYTVSRMMVRQDVNVTRFGVVQKSNPDSQPLQADRFERNVMDSTSQGGVYLKDAIKYIEANKALYPEFKCGGGDNIEYPIKINNVKGTKPDLLNRRGGINIVKL